MDSEYPSSCFLLSSAQVQPPFLTFSTYTLFPRYTRDYRSRVTLNRCIHSRLWALPAPRKTTCETNFILT